MDETRWLTAITPLPLLGYVRRECRAARTKAGRRKLRLFACACCRRVWPILSPEQRAVVETVEQAAEGRATLDDVERAWAAANQWIIPRVAGLFRGLLGRILGRPEPPSEPLPPPAQPASVATLMMWLIRRQAWATVYTSRAAAAPDLTAVRGTRPAAEKRLQTELVRCLFGNPFQPTTFHPDWRTSTAVGLARAISTEFAYDRLPILADALEEAGCDDEQVLRHCREHTIHTRGCWVVDLVLRK